MHADHTHAANTGTGSALVWLVRGALLLQMLTLRSLYVHLDDPPIPGSVLFAALCLPLVTIVGGLLVRGASGRPSWLVALLGALLLALSLATFVLGMLTHSH